MTDIGNPATAAAPISRITVNTMRAPCVTRTLCDHAEERKRQDDLGAVRLRKLPFILLRLPPRQAMACRPTLLAQLKYASSHQSGIAEVICQREHRGDHAKAQYCCVGCLVTVIGERDVAVHTSICDSIRDDVGETEAHRAD